MYGEEIFKGDEMVYGCPVQSTGRAMGSGLIDCLTDSLLKMNVKETFF